MENKIHYPITLSLVIVNGGFRILGFAVSSLFNFSPHIYKGSLTLWLFLFDLLSYSHSLGELVVVYRRGLDWIGLIV